MDIDSFSLQWQHLQNRIHLTFPGCVSFEMGSTWACPFFSSGCKGSQVTGADYLVDKACDLGPPFLAAEAKQRNARAVKACSEGWLLKLLWIQATIPTLSRQSKQPGTDGGNFGLMRDTESVRVATCLKLQIHLGGHISQEDTIERNCVRPEDYLSTCLSSICFVNAIHRSIGTTREL